MAKKKTQARFAWVPASHLEGGYVNLEYFNSNSIKEAVERMKKEVEFEPEILLEDNDREAVYIMEIVKKYVVTRGGLTFEEVK